MKNLTHEKIANRLGISRPAVTQWFTGNTAPSLSNAIKLEEEFGIPCKAWKDIKFFLESNKAKK
jgi:transcriptional regulator with XRE-family HTH domain